MITILLTILLTGRWHLRRVALRRLAAGAV
jgi:hypothetical protein